MLHRSIRIGLSSARIRVSKLAAGATSGSTKATTGRAPVDFPAVAPVVSLVAPVAAPHVACRTQKYRLYAYHCSSC